MTEGEKEFYKGKLKESEKMSLVFALLCSTFAFGAGAATFRVVSDLFGIDVAVVVTMVIFFLILLSSFVVMTIVNK